ncbi:MAG: hypothetical protein IPJ32_06005 [Sphingobacteriaceae bacterium]|nr:hypothetical protein [Sphingobacteriaceae bacterium]
MKKLFIPTLITLVATLYFGCAKKKTNVEFDISYSTDIAVPTYSAANQTYTFNTNDILTYMGSELEKNGTNADLVGEIKYTQFNVAVKTPTTGQSINFIKQMRFYVNAINQPEQQVAFKYNDKNDTIKPVDKSTSFKINDVNLKNRFLENSVYFYVKLMPAYIPVSTTITVTHNIHVKAITQ